ENAVIERLNKRIQETQFEETKKILQEELGQEMNHQNVLKDLISEYGGTPTNSKAELLSLNSPTGQPTTIDITDNSVASDSKIRSMLKGNDNYNATSMDFKDTQLQSEILRTKEDAMIKNAEILGYKIVLEKSEKINATKATSILKKNMEEKELTYDRLVASVSKMVNSTDVKSNKKNEQQHGDPFQIGSTIADILTSYWNSKQNPSKVYIFNRRVHHGAIGALLGLSALYKKQPMITGILSGLGAGLAKDDYNDVKEWFLFKKKEDEQVK
ncbi:MAG TPA: hypothetical protein VE619_01130, partial [Nitrososphaeraceae archaeon]|nr:hypothetical protein [Nitrososphaeraceae archaeon]